jgi:hypothetical protein
MPRYFFHLNDGRRIISDPEGTELADDAVARDHASQVVRELTRNREESTSLWRLAVRDGHGTLRFELLFASVDEPASRLPRGISWTIEGACRATFAERLHRRGLDNVISISGPRNLGGM